MLICCHYAPYRQAYQLDRSAASNWPARAQVPPPHPCAPLIPASSWRLLRNCCTPAAGSRVKKSSLRGVAVTCLLSATGPSAQYSPRGLPCRFRPPGKYPNESVRVPAACEPSGRKRLKSPDHGPQRKSLAAPSFLQGITKHCCTITHSKRQVCNESFRMQESRRPKTCL